MKRGTNIYPLSRNCRKGFQGQRSKVKVMAKLNVIMAKGCIAFCRSDVEAHWLFIHSTSIKLH